MVGTDPIADMLTRIRNAVLVNKPAIVVPFSNLKLRLAEELKNSGFIAEVNTEGEGKERVILVRLRDEDEPNRISMIERVSKPGRRLYARAGHIPRIMNGRGIVILSTSSGLMSDRTARKQGIGGELICKVY